jgi:hypothetical protein
MKQILGALIILVGVAVQLSDAGSSYAGDKPHVKKKATAAAASTPGMCDPITQLRKLGLITDVRAGGFKIYVSSLWYAMPLSSKENAAVGMLACLNPGNSYIEIYDDHSGKEVAKYGTASGFASYQ